MQSTSNAKIPDTIDSGVAKNDVRFGQLLISKGLLTRDQLTEVLKQQQEQGGRVGEILRRLNLISEENITVALAELLSLEYVGLGDTDDIDMNVARLLPESVAKRFCLISIREEEGKIVVAMADPLDVIAIDTITLKIKREIKVVVSSTHQIKRAIELIYHGSDVEEQNLRDLVKTEVDKEQKSQQLEDLGVEEESATRAPVIRFVDLLLSQAVKSRASDIHIEPQERSMMIRMRIDGVLRNMVPPAKGMQSAIVTRIKILSEMDIAERRLPQDGRFKMKTSGRDIDVRVSVIPTIYGEKVVMRILDAAAINHNIDQLGFEPQLLEEFKHILARPYGVIIVTGPTGSGKTTTLYSALNYLKDPAKNITTVEDPVEYRLEGINQIQVKQEIDLGFATCLRAILRQDPDIILVGEVRDKETVDIVIKASLTGHLVLSTFHTNDAASAISRLIYMGVESYLLASSLNLIVAQRLVRKICDNCRETVSPDPEILKRLDISPEKAKETVFYKGRGCKSCKDTGYWGRLPIFEFLVIDNDIREKLVAGYGESKIRALSREKGYGSLFESALNKLTQGLTTAEEVLRVTFTENVKA